MKLTSAGATSGTIKEYPHQLQGTAMAASPTGGYLIAGVGDVNKALGVSVPSYKGRVSRIDASGNLLWNISVTADGIDSTVIYTECWGVEPSAGASCVPPAAHRAPYVPAARWCATYTVRLVNSSQTAGTQRATATHPLVHVSAPRCVHRRLDPLVRLGHRE